MQDPLISWDCMSSIEQQDPENGWNCPLRNKSHKDQLKTSNDVCKYKRAPMIINLILCLYDAFYSIRKQRQYVNFQMSLLSSTSKNSRHICINNHLDNKRAATFNSSIRCIWSYGTKAISIKAISTTTENTTESPAATASCKRN